MAKPIETPADATEEDEAAEGVRVNPAISNAMSSGFCSQSLAGAHRPATGLLTGGDSVSRFGHVGRQAVLGVSRPGMLGNSRFGRVAILNGVLTASREAGHFRCRR